MSVGGERNQAIQLPDLDQTSQEETLSYSLKVHNVFPA